MKRPTTRSQPLGSVHGDELLPLRVFCRRLGIGRKAWAVLVRRGFPVIRCRKQGFVDGAAALAYFRAQARSNQGVEMRTQQVATTWFSCS